MSVLLQFCLDSRELQLTKLASALQILLDISARRISWSPKVALHGSVKFQTYIYDTFYTDCKFCNCAKDVPVLISKQSITKSERVT